MLYLYLFFLPSTRILFLISWASSVLFLEKLFYSLWTFNIFLFYFFFPQDSVNLNRCTKGKVKSFISSNYFLLINSLPVFLGFNPMVLTSSSFLSVPYSITESLFPFLLLLFLNLLLTVLIPEFGFGFGFWWGFFVYYFFLHQNMEQFYFSSFKSFKPEKITFFFFRFSNPSQLSGLQRNEVEPCTSEEGYIVAGVCPLRNEGKKKPLQN